MPTEAPKQIRYTDFLKRLELSLHSEVPLPNVKLIEDPQEALRQISQCHIPTDDTIGRIYKFVVREFDPPLPSGQVREVAYYPHIFLHGDGMAGTFDGTGVILSNVGGETRAYSFAMCEHEWNTSGANHSRGWHPRRCMKCGFDASIDSGD